MEVKLTFLTPAFLYGAFQTRPEFRIPSLIGQMRYWWRMTQDWSKVKEMREKETKIFGLGEDRAKPFYVYVVSQNLSENRSKEQNKPKNQPFRREYLPENFNDIRRAHKKLSYNERSQRLFYNGFMHDQDFENLIAKFGENNKTSIANLYKKTHRYVFSNEQDGLSYLFYPFNQNRQELFSWLAPSSKVVLNFEFLNEKNEKEEIKTDVLLSLFLLARFGGLGSRSRRGAGAIEISSEGCDLFDLTESQVEKYIGNNDHAYFSKIRPNSPLFMAFKNPKRFKLKVKTASTWETPLKDVGAKMNNFRTKQRLREQSDPAPVDPKFREEAIDLHKYFASERNPPSELTKDVFGLPRIVNFSVPRGQDAIRVAPFHDEGGKLKMGRRASPLHITVNRVSEHNESKYYCTLLILWEPIPFLPDKLPARLKHRTLHQHYAGNKLEDLPELSIPDVPEKLETFLERLS